MDPQRPRAEAVGIAGGRVVATGSRSEAAAACPAGTPVLDLPGTVVPGLIDSHVHMLWGGRDAERLDVSAARSVPDVLRAVAEAAAALPADAWILGSAGLDADDLAEGRFPTRDELDTAAGGRPVFL